MRDLLDSSSQKQGPNYIGGVLPNAGTVLVLGICSIIGSFIFAVPGLICGIIALVTFRKDKMIYLSDPERYRESYKVLNAGFVCAIIGMSLSGLFFLRLLFLLATGEGLVYGFSF